MTPVLSRARALLEQARSLMARGDVRGAEHFFQQVLRQDRRNPLALNGLGNLAVTAKRYDDAVDFHRRAVKSAPKDPGLLNDFGNSLILAGEPQSAIPHLRKAIERAPQLYPVLFNLARAHRDMDEPDRALAILDKIAATFLPKGAVTQTDIDLERAMTFARVGRFAEAMALFRTVLKVRPADARALDGIAICHRATESDNDLAAAEAALAQPQLTPLQRAIAHRTAGKILEDLRRYDDAFQQFRRANEVQATSFDMRRHWHFVAESMRLFTPAFFAERTAFGDPSEQPVFIVGMPRSGTTLVEQIIASHPDVSGVGELPDIERTLSAAIGAQLPGVEASANRIGDLSANAVRSQAKSYLAVLSQRGGRRVRVADKMPHNFQALGWIALMFPKARVIHCTRDPMDVCVSCYCHHFSREHGYSNDLHTLGQYYRSYELLMQHWRSVLPLAILEVRYEDVVSDLEAQARRMIAHLGLEWNEACLSYHRTSRAVQTPSRWQVRQPIYQGSVERWRRYESHLGPLIEGLASDPRQLMAEALKVS